MSRRQEEDEGVCPGVSGGETTPRTGSDRPRHVLPACPGTKTELPLGSGVWRSLWQLKVDRCLVELCLKGHERGGREGG